MSTASKTHATGRIEVKTYEPQPYSVLARPCLPVR